MTLEQLQTFLAVAQTQHFGLAAKQLFLSQPAVSKRIALLEDSLNTILFDRIGKQVYLTPAGKRLLKRAPVIIESIADLKRDITNLNTSVTGILTIATSHHIGLHRLPPILEQFSINYPDVNLELRFLSSEAAYEQISAGKIDLAIITLPTSQPSSPANKNTPITQTIIWQDPLYFVCHSRHPLTQIHSPTLSDLMNHKGLLPQEQSTTREIIDTVFTQQNLVLKKIMTINYLETIRRMTEVGLGWSILPASMLTPSLHKINLDTPPLSRQLGYVLNTERTLPNAAHKFINLLQSVN